MSIRRILSIVIALFLSLSVIVPASAADGDTKAFINADRTQIMAVTEIEVGANASAILESDEAVDQVFANSNVTRYVDLSSEHIVGDYSRFYAVEAPLEGGDVPAFMLFAANGTTIYVILYITNASEEGFGVALDYLERLVSGAPMTAPNGWSEG